MSKRKKSSRKHKTTNAHKQSSENNQIASVKDTLLSARYLVDNSADNIEGMIKLLTFNRKTVSVSPEKDVNSKAATSMERLKTGVEQAKSSFEKQNSRESKKAAKSIAKTGKSISKTSLPPQPGRSFVKKPDIKYSFMMDPYLRLTSPPQQNDTTKTKNVVDEEMILCSMKEPIRIFTIARVNQTYNGDVYLEQKTELLGKVGKTRKSELAVLNPKVMHLPPAADDKKYYRPESKVTLSACDGRLRLIRTIKLSPIDRHISPGILYEEKRVYHQGNAYADHVPKIISNEKRSSTETMIQEFCDPTYAKYHQKVLINGKGNCKVIDLMELRCIESNKRPNKKLVSKVNDNYNKKDARSFAAKLCNYKQSVGYGKGLLIIETALELPTMANSKENSYVWHEARSYTTNNFEICASGFPLLTSQCSSNEKSSEQLKPIAAATEQNPKIADGQAASPPESGLSDTSAGGGSESGNDHSPHPTDLNVSTARGRGFLEESPPTAVCPPSSTNTAVSPSGALLCKHGLQDDIRWSKSANIWRKQSPSLRQKLPPLPPPFNKTKENATRSHIFRATDDVTQSDFSAEPRSQHTDVSRKSETANEPNTVTIFLSDEHGLKVEIMANIGMKLINDDGSKTGIKLFKNRKISIDGHVVYED